MSYSSVEAAVLTLLQALTGTFAATTDVSRGDYRILDSGADAVAVLVPGAFEQDGIAEGGARKSVRDWNVLIDLFRKYLDEGTTWTNFETDRDAVIAELEKYPTLNGEAGIVRGIISADADAGEVFDEDDNGPFFVWQRLRIKITERADLSGGEFT
ncbi:hypothetical protein LCGC14_0401010 [marine sediment metagenome]|uniref:Uncharacterized protein n=1 Tax=marine sediment metagenome TaxID=412755 RepID=A0A0F9W5V7_9ZZZZ